MARIELPKINDRAWIAFDRSLGETFPSRVETCEDNRYSIAAPFKLLDNDRRKPIPIYLPDIPAEVVLAWCQENGYAFIDATVNEVIDGDLTLWNLEVTGSPDIIQRRSFVRVPDSSEAEVALDGRLYSSILIDLSEGGLQCTIPFTEVEDNSEMSVNLFVENHSIPIKCRIIRHEITEEGRVELAVGFLNVEEHITDTIRRHVFGKQIQQYKTT